MYQVSGLTVGLLLLGVMVALTALYVMRRRVRLGKKQGTF